MLPKWFELSLLKKMCIQLYSTLNIRYESVYNVETKIAKIAHKKNICICPPPPRVSRSK